MPAHFTRFAALPLLVAAVLAAGCAVAPAQENDATSASDLTLVLGPAYQISVDPIALCSATAADHWTPYPASPGYLAKGTSNAANSCDYYVTEVAGVLGKDITLAVAAQPDLFTDQASCVASFETFETFGYVPQHWEKNANGLYFPVAGAWKYIASKTIKGVWLGAVAAGPNCAFNAFVNPYGAATSAGAGEIDGSPYSTIRVATKAVFYANGASYRSQMGTYVVPH